MRKFLEKKIGNHVLFLDSANKHERKYYKKRNHIDAMLGEAFVKKGFNVLDLGANVGFCALHYLKNGASNVDAYEPQHELFLRLKAIEAPSLNAFEIAVSDEAADLDLYISTAHNQGHTLELEQVKLHRKVFPDQLIVQKVRTKLLDDIYGESEIFDFIKMDIEGYELRALKGGAKLLSRSRNCILQVEIYDKFFEQTVFELSKTFNHIYKVFYSEDAGKFYLSKNISEVPVFGFKDKPPNYICSNRSLDEYALSSTVTCTDYLIYIGSKLKNLVMM